MVFYDESGNPIFDVIHHPNTDSYSTVYDRIDTQANEINQLHTQIDESITEQQSSLRPSGVRAQVAYKQTHKKDRMFRLKEKLRQKQIDTNIKKLEENRKKLYDAEKELEDYRKKIEDYEKEGYNVDITDSGFEFWKPQVTTPTTTTPTEPTFQSEDGTTYTQAQLEKQGYTITTNPDGTVIATSPTMEEMGKSVYEVMVQAMGKDRANREVLYTAVTQGWMGIGYMVDFIRENIGVADSLLYKSYSSGLKEGKWKTAAEFADSYYGPFGTDEEKRQFALNIERMEEGIINSSSDDFYRAAFRFGQYQTQTGGRGFGLEGMKDFLLSPAGVSLILTPVLSYGIGYGVGGASGLASATAAKVIKMGHPIAGKLISGITKGAGYGLLGTAVVGTGIQIYSGFQEGGLTGAAKSATTSAIGWSAGISGARAGYQAGYNLGYKPPNWDVRLFHGAQPSSSRAPDIISARKYLFSHKGKTYVHYGEHLVSFGRAKIPPPLPTPKPFAMTEYSPIIYSAPATTQWKTTVGGAGVYRPTTPSTVLTPAPVGSYRPPGLANLQWTTSSAGIGYYKPIKKGTIISPTEGVTSYNQFPNLKLTTSKGGITSYKPVTAGKVLSPIQQKFALDFSRLKPPVHKFGIEVQHPKKFYFDKTSKGKFDIVTLKKGLSLTPKKLKLKDAAIIFGSKQPGLRMPLEYPPSTLVYPKPIVWKRVAGKLVLWDPIRNIPVHKLAFESGVPHQWESLMSYTKPKTKLFTFKDVIKKFKPLKTKGGTVSGDRQQTVLLERLKTRLKPKTKHEQVIIQKRVHEQLRLQHEQQLSYTRQQLRISKKVPKYVVSIPKYKTAVGYVSAQKKKQTPILSTLYAKDIMYAEDTAQKFKVKHKQDFRTAFVPATMSMIMPKTKTLKVKPILPKKPKKDKKKKPKRKSYTLKGGRRMRKFRGYDIPEIKIPIYKPNNIYGDDKK